MSLDRAWMAARARARALVSEELTLGSEVEIEAWSLLKTLRSFREFGLLVSLGQKLLNQRPGEPYLRRLVAQGLLDCDDLAGARSLLDISTNGLSRTHPEWAELNGLAGRLYKQLALVALNDDKADFVRKSIEAYERAYALEEGPKHYWHAVNLVAMLDYANRRGIAIEAEHNTVDLACIVQKAISNDCRPWALATRAELALFLDGVEPAMRLLRDYLRHPDTGAFELGSTLRQLRDVWEVETREGAFGTTILEALRVRLLQLPGAHLTLKTEDLADTAGHSLTAAERGVLEAILGQIGPVSYGWYDLGRQRCLSVAAIREGVRSRVGTGFLVRARDLGFENLDEVVLITNHHVVNSTGAGGALTPERARVTFEIADPTLHYRVDRVLWESPPDQHDTAVLLLKEPPPLPAMPISPYLPIVESGAQVYIIGHPDGADLCLSLNDTALLDHDGPPDGQPRDAVCRMHYRTPTEKGSSGSPVFNASDWEVIALHHAGGEMKALNGKAGSIHANEGIGMESIRRAIRAQSFDVELTT